MNQNISIKMLIPALKSLPRAEFGGQRFDLGVMSRIDKLNTGHMPCIGEPIKPQGFVTVSMVVVEYRAPDRSRYLEWEIMV